MSALVMRRSFRVPRNLRSNHVKSENSNDFKKLPEKADRGESHPSMLFFREVERSAGLVVAAQDESDAASSQEA